MKKIEIGEMLDITDPKGPVEVTVREDGQVVWVNVNGVCRLRICAIGDNQIILEQMGGKKFTVGKEKVSKRDPSYEGRMFPP